MEKEIMKKEILKIFKEAEKVKDDDEKFDKCISRLSEMKAKSKEDGNWDKLRSLLISDEEIIVFMISLSEKILSSSERRKKLKNDLNTPKGVCQNTKVFLKGGKNKL